MKSAKLRSKSALFRSAAVTRLVTLGFLPEQLLTHVVFWLDGPNLLTTLELRAPDERQLGEIDACSIGSNDPVAAYRNFLILGALPEITMELMTAAIIASHGPITDDPLNFVLVAGPNGLEDPKAMTAKARDAIGKKKFDKIMTELPPDLDQLLLRLVEAGYTLHLAGLVKEIEAGRLQPTTYQKSLGINHPEVIKARDARLLEGVQRLKPQFLAMLGEGHQDCSCTVGLLTDAADCYLKGITDDAEVLGMAFVRYLERKSLSISLVESLYFGGGPAPEERQTDRRIADVVRLLVEKCPDVAQRSEREYRETFAGYRRDWAKRPLAVVE